MSEASPQIREEYFENEPTGVEVEDLEAAPGIDRPWDPADIRVSTRQFSLRNVLDMVQDGDLELAPDFQRNKVWKDHQKSRLVESVLLQIPLPAFYFAEDASGLRRVVDGVQRLSTICAFVYGGAESFKRSYSAGVRAGGSQAPVVKSWWRTSSLSRPHLVAVSR